MIIVNKENPKRTVNPLRENTPKDNTSPSHIAIGHEDEQTLFSAKPAFAENDTDVRLHDELESANQFKLATDVLVSQESVTDGIHADESLVSSSSMEDSMKIYNVPKGEIVKTPRDNVDAESGCGIDLDNNDNIVIRDKSFEMVGEKWCTHPAQISNENMENGSDGKAMEEFVVNLPKVKDLAKKFVVDENAEEIHPPKSTPKRRKFHNEYELEVVNRSDAKMADKHNHMHSLTARSLSREFREGLRLSMATPIKVPGGAKDPPDVPREHSRPPSPVPEPGTLKNKLAFFESLKF